MARFYDVLLRALFHGLDRRIHGGVGGDDDDGSLRANAVNFHHRFDTIHAPGHFQIDEADGKVC